MCSVFTVDGVLCGVCGWASTLRLERRGVLGDGCAPFVAFSLVRVGWSGALLMLMFSFSMKWCLGCAFVRVWSFFGGVTRLLNPESYPTGLLQQRCILLSFL